MAVDERAGFELSLRLLSNIHSLVLGLGFRMTGLGLRISIQGLGFSVHSWC